jgi:aryl-alcohol dehydrogenase-like predicted oxidoreductase
MLIEEFPMRSRIQKIGLGTWAFGGRAYGPMEDAVSLAVAKRAYELGIRAFDTAAIYANGRSEELLSEALEPRGDAKVYTKIGYDTSSGKAVKRYDLEFLEQSLGLSLSRLKRTSIDLLLLHNPPTEVLESGDAFRWLKQKIEEGKIARWGVSVYDSARDAELALNAGAHAIEARYSLLRRDVLDALPKAKDFEFIARSPMDGGLLSGKYTGKETFPKTDQRSAQNSAYFAWNREFLNELRPLLEDGTAASFSELALRFAAFAPGISITIPGAKSLAQLEANVASVLKGPLPTEALMRIESVRERYIDRIP